MEKFKSELIDVMNKYDFMIKHERNKVKEVSKTIKRIIKVNEGTENKIDLEPYFKEREQHMKMLSNIKQDVKKLNRVYKIIFDN